MADILPNTLWAYRPALPKVPGSESWTPVEVSAPLSGTGRRHGTHSEDRNAGLREPGRQGVLRACTANPALDGVAREAAVPRPVPPGADGRTSGAGTGTPYVVWPDRLLYAEKTMKAEVLAGFTMPVVEGAQPLTTFITPRHRARFFRHASADAAYWLAGRIAECVADLHGREKASGILITDLTPRNILVSPELGVRFIDADSFQYRLATGIHRSLEVDAGLPGAAYRRRRSQRSGAAGIRDRRRCLCARNRPLPRARRRRPPVRAGAAFEVNGVEPDEEDNMLARRFPYVDAARMGPPKIRLQTWQKLPERVKAAFEQVFVKGVVVPPRAWAELLAKARLEAGSVQPTRPAPKPSSPRPTPPPASAAPAATHIADDVHALVRKVVATIAPSTKRAASATPQPAKAPRRPVS
ncbi:MAG: hypothetical protein R3D33_18565 [Hyphomicrobiaceae bacterium]